jgi:hypothetical protein
VNYTFFNATEHAIRIRIDESSECEPMDTDIVITPSGTVTRVSYPESGSGVEGFKLFEFPGTLTDLPDRNTTAVVIMSMPSAQTLAVTHPGWFTNGGMACSPGDAIRYPKGHKLQGLVFAVRNFFIWR